jgi:hypothetical protein
MAYTYVPTVQIFPDQGVGCAGMPGVGDIAPWECGHADGEYECCSNPNCTCKWTALIGLHC